MDDVNELSAISAIKPETGVLDELVALASAFPVDGWAFSDWKYEQRLPHLKISAKLAKFANQLEANVRSFGFVAVDLEPILDFWPATSSSAAITLLLTTIGRPIRVFTVPPATWREVGVDLTRPADRSRGVGRLPLHIDFVNASDPPEFSCLLCLRPDPACGGETLIADALAIEHRLTAAALAELSQAAFRDGVVEGLVNIGEDANPFKVIDRSGAFLCRYTGHLRSTHTEPSAMRSLEEIHELLEGSAITYRMKRGHLLILDQRRTLHGRLPLGPQEHVPEDQRRLLVLSFLRAYDHASETNAD